MRDDVEPTNIEIKYLRKELEMYKSGNFFDRAITAMTDLAETLTDSPDKMRELRGAIAMLKEWRGGRKHEECVERDPQTLQDKEDL